MRTVIIGGVAGGMSAATRLRRLDENAEIIVLERGAHVSFANCGLPYHVGGVIPERSSLLLHSPASLAARFRIDARTGHEALTIDPAARTVRVRRPDGSEVDEHYDNLILSPGAETDASLPGDDSVPVHALRSIEDLDAIMAALAEVPADRPARVVVAGGGFIGLEAVENLRARGADTWLIQSGTQLLGPLDPEMAVPVYRTVVDAGVEVRLGRRIARIEEGAAVLDSGEHLPVDLVLHAAGVRPATALALSAGITLGPTGGIAVDEAQRTNIPNIYAVGDAVEKIDAISGEPVLSTLAGPANRHGRAAANAIAGRPGRARPALGTAIIGVFGLTAAVTGWNEKSLVRAGRAYQAVHTHPINHAGYYPGAEGLSIKLLLDPETRAILGAQVIGGAGVDKRIDVIATAMRAGLDADELGELELAYAPQYGSAKDPVNLVGHVAGNILDGLIRTIQWHELDAAVAAGATLVDVRTPGEHDRGAPAGSVNIPLDEIRERHGELPSGPIIVHCQVGQRGHTAARLLEQLGHETLNLDGGYRTWADGRAAEKLAMEATA